MKKVLGIFLALTSLACAGDAAIDASINLVKPIEISTSANKTTKSILNTTTGIVEFPGVEILTTGSAGEAITLTTEQNLDLVSGINKIAVNVAFSSGVLTTDGTNAVSSQILDASGSIKNDLLISTNLLTGATAGQYKGTATIVAAYN